MGLLKRLKHGKSGPSDAQHTKNDRKKNETEKEQIPLRLVNIF